MSAAGMMLHRFAVILLAVAVFVMNAYCGCAHGMSSMTGFAAEAHASRAEPEHSDCKGHGPEQPQDSNHDEHDCRHCTGQVSADTNPAKTNLSGPLLSPVFWSVGELADHLARSFATDSFDHTGLPPPLPPPTLLNQFCSFNN